MKTPNRAVVFPTAFGWTSLVGAERFVSRLSFGHATPPEALAAVSDGNDQVEEAGAFGSLVRRLQQYAEGVEDDFLDVELAPEEQTPFQRRVVELCRRIPYGSSLTYGQLAERAGHPGAARAVGNCMRINPTPLIVPCHRVVGAGGAMRGYSAGEGVRMKLRLLEMEAASVAPSAPGLHGNGLVRAAGALRTRNGRVKLPPQASLNFGARLAPGSLPARAAKG